ncbi:MAG: UDP-N-acetylmuramoyl-L-alanine--D-glutamate ligase, partial [Burkholderiaceae bacterium]
RLGSFDVVIKSPGISPYRPEAMDAAARGTRFIGGTALWFAEHPQARTICITGTKGKSTTTALLAHLLRCGGHRTALAGNIGMPMLELVDAEAEFWAIELSSYQTGDVADSGVRPEVAVVLNLFPEHLDWHGSERRYFEDKLALIVRANPRIAILNANDPMLHAFAETGSWSGDMRWFGRPDGWHLRGDDVYRGESLVMNGASLPLAGRHNRANLCAALTAIDALGLDATALAKNAASFQPLPHRLQVLGTRNGITWVDDSISTTPHASLAALELYREQPVVLLLGGHDRGLDWSGFVETMRTNAPRAIVTMGENGPRIHAMLQDSANAACTLVPATDLPDAVAQARALSPDVGVVMLSPGAPSFGPYSDYGERGRHFATLAGFDSEAIGTIQGLGVT